MTGRISVFLYNSRFSFIKALVAAAFAILLVCGFNGAASGQGEGAIQAIVEKSSYAGAKAGTSSEGQGQARSSNPPRAAKAAVPKPTTRTTVRSTSPGQAGKYNGSIIGDKYSFLNFEIASKVQPVWTIAAQNAHAAGLVQVEVLIDQNGRVLTEHA